jgi:hypothetical protein
MSVSDAKVLTAVVVLAAAGIVGVALGPLWGTLLALAGAGVFALILR